MLLPGMDGTGNLFEPFRAALGDAFAVRVVRYPTSGALGYEELEAIARASLPSSGDFVLLGESFSGPIAVAIAAKPPPGLLGVVLCSSFVRNPQPALAGLRKLAGLLPVKLVPERALSYFLLGQFATPSLRAALRSAMSQVANETLQVRLNEVATVDMSDKLKAMRVPLLYLKATNDRLVAAACADYIAHLFPATQVRMIRAPHFLLQAAPAEAALAVIEFARSCQAQA